MKVVPCNGCTRCCSGKSIRPLEPEEAGFFAAVPHPYEAGKFVLASKAGGACVYVEDGQCRIHAVKPRLCHAFDCRDLAGYSFTFARKAKIVSIWRKGRELIKEGK